VASHGGGQFRIDVDVIVAKKGHWGRDLCSVKWYTALSAIPNEGTYKYILKPQEPTNTKDILVPIASTPTINQPQAAADSNSKSSNPSGNSKGGNSGSSSESQMKNHIGSSSENDDEDESEDEDDKDPPAVIDKSKKSSFKRELAGLNGNPRSAWEAPEGSYWRRSRTDHRRPSSRWLEIDSAVVHWEVQSDAHDIVLRIRCDFWCGILSFFISWKDNRFGGALGMADCLGGPRHGLSFKVFFIVSFYGRDTALEECRADFKCGHHVVLD